MPGINQLIYIVFYESCRKSCCPGRNCLLTRCCQGSTKRTLQPTLAAENNDMKKLDNALQIYHLIISLPAVRVKLSVSPAAIHEKRPACRHPGFCVRDNPAPLRGLDWLVVVSLDIS